EGAGQQRQSDSSLHVTFTRSQLEAATQHHVAVREQINHPLRVKISGPGDCDVMGGYEYLVRIRDTRNKVDTLVWTNHNSVSGEVRLNLPPLVYSVQVVDVNKPDAFSQSVIDYFRSRALTVDNIGGYQEYLETKRTSLRDTTWHFRYNERATLSVTGLPAAIKCNGQPDRYVMDGVAEEQATLVVTPYQTINGVRCEAKTGYMLARFPGGTVTNPQGNDTINVVGGTWESVVLTATTPNLAAPNTQLLEFYYYDESGNFQGTWNQEILVTGRQKAPGQDVFVIPQGAAGVAHAPLYVLRDPPGDQSSAYISEKSSLSFSFESLTSHNFNTTYNGELEGTTAGVFIRVKENYGVNQTTGGYRKNTMSIEFSQDITTASASNKSENLEGYLDGPDADIIIGASLNMAYGILEILSFDNCTVSKKKELDVSPTQIKSVWAYTRSQIQNTINYYGSLVQGSNGSYQIADGVAFSSESKDISGDIGLAKERYQSLLDIVDTRFTPMCEMCSYTFKPITPSHFGTKYQEYSQAVKQFCTTYVKNADGTCKSIPFLTANWDSTQRKDYADVYKMYLAALEIDKYHQMEVIGKAAAFVSSDRISRELNNELNTIEKYAPMENITFGAGATVARTVDNSQSEFSSSNFSMGTELSLVLGAGVAGDFRLNTLISSHDFAKGRFVRGVTLLYKGSSQVTQGNSRDSGFKTGFTLGDDDDGDHFSIDVFHSWIDGATKTSPYFNLIGGRSSCPYEEGTIPRDMPRIQVGDANGLVGTKFYDLDPNVPIAIPITLSSGNLFNENRLVAVTTALGSNKNGVGLEMESAKLSPTGGPEAWIAPETSYYGTLYVNQAKLPVYDFVDVELVAKPACNRFDYWEHKDVMDTVKLEFYFRKPISPITLETDQATWSVRADQNTQDNVNEEAIIFKLKNYDVEQLRHSLKEVYLEYKRTNQESDAWTRIVDDSYKLEVLPVDSLLRYFRQKRNTYPEPTYPFTWNLADPVLYQGLVNGTYQVRATVVHENGSFAYSNVLTGTIDREGPQVVGIAAPTDSVLSQGDAVSIGFHEFIDRAFYLTSGTHKVEVLAENDKPKVELTYSKANSALSQYEVDVTIRGVSITIDREVLQTYDGRRVKVTLTGIKDMLGNVSTPATHTWEFTIDYFKQSPSPVTLLSPQNWVINQSSGSQMVDFIITDYDVFQATTSMDSIALQIRREGETTWSTVTHRTAAELAARYRTFLYSGQPPLDTLTWNATNQPDGRYTARAVAVGNTGRQNFSGTLSGLKDRIAPALLGTPAPADSVFDWGDEVSFTFTEALDCQAAGIQYTSRVVTYGTTDTTDLAYTSAVCTGNGFLFTYAEDTLKKYFGGTVIVAVSGIKDLAGNPAAHGSKVTYTFTIGQWGESTSPVSLLTPVSNWLVNSSHPSVTFTLGDYDVFETATTLDSITLEYRAPADVSWKRIQTVTQDSLAKYYTATRTASNDHPHYPITWTPVIADGNYSVRAVAYGAHGFAEYSGERSGRIDVSAPWVTKITPGNDTLKHTEPILVTFTESIAASSLKSDSISLHERVLVQPLDGSPGYFNYIKLPSAMVEMAHSGNKIEFYFDRQFTSNYHGKTLRLRISGVTDEVGNVLNRSVDTLFHVQNVTPASSQRLVSLDFTGEQVADGSIVLQWNAVDPAGTQAYVVERSRDGEFFQSIAQLTEAEGYQEVVRFEEAIYYRLRLQRTDGTETYSAIAVIQDNGLAQPLTTEVYPNPIEDGTLRYSWYSKGSEESLTLEVRDLRGALLYTETVDPATRGLKQSVKLPEHLETGLYMMHLTQGNQTQSVKFIKQ
ncbi:MAG TPA: hypothetical protein DCR93_04010, partial [Cytophagales bacterium]|nr:hypothetical protein [Cytophagales bacterium]